MVWNYTNIYSLSEPEGTILQERKKGSTQKRMNEPLLIVQGKINQISHSFDFLVIQTVFLIRPAVAVKRHVAHCSLIIYKLKVVTGVGSRASAGRIHIT